MNTDKIKEVLEATFNLATDCISRPFSEYEKARAIIESVNLACDFNEFTRECRNPDDCLEDMEMLDELDWKPSYVLQRAFYGWDYNPNYVDDGSMGRQPFNPNAKYFTFNGYGNLVSVRDYDWHAYWKQNLELDEYLEYAYKYGKLEEVAEALEIEED